jgi:hypothetical protein
MSTIPLPTHPALCGGSVGVGVPVENRAWVSTMCDNVPCLGREFALNSTTKNYIISILQLAMRVAGLDNWYARICGL